MNKQDWWHTALKIENGPKCLKRKMEKEMFEEENEEHGFDFLGHHFAINRSANEKLKHSIMREQFSILREFRELEIISSCY